MNTIKLWTSAALAACMTLGGCRLNDNCRGTAVERRVAFLGGSITEMHGYRPRVMAMLQKKYPDVKFVEIAAGLSSTCSDTGAFRLREYVLDKGVPDLLIVDFSVNDPGDGRFDRRHCIRGMEGVLRQMREANPKCALVVAMFVAKDQYDLLLTGQEPMAYTAHKDVAAHYGAAVANVGAALAKSAKAGGLDWKIYRDCHPSPEGCDFGAQVVMDAIGEVFDPYAPRQLGMPPLMDAGSYCQPHRVPTNAVKVVAGQWQYSIPDWTTVPGNVREPYKKSAMWWTLEANAALEITFEGSTLGTFLLAGPDAGELEVTVDGGAPRRYRLRVDYGDLHYPYTQILADDLPRGVHKVLVRSLAFERKGSPTAALRLFRLYTD